jgi:cytochrome c oxidase subunit III
MSVTMTADALAERWHVRSIGLWMFLGTLVMLFAAFTSALVVRQNGSDWQSPDLPAILWVNTAVIAASSIALERARRGGLTAAGTPALVGLAGLLGVGFLGGQIWAWRDLIDAGIYLPTNPASSFLYVLTGVHGVHVVAAVGFLAYLFVKTITRKNREEWPYLAGAVATFWHFLAATWGYLFVVLRLV